MSDQSIGPCPRCSAERAPASRGWCLACGYHPEIETAETAVAKPAGASVTWLWILLGGVFLILVASVAAHFLLRPNSLSRASAGSALLVLSALGLVLAQVWVYLYIFDKDHTASFMAPVKMWMSAIASMPEARYPVYAGSWSLTAILCSVFIVGGQMYWLDHLKRKKPEKPKPVLIIKKLGGEAGDVDQSVQDFANMVQIVDAPSDLAPKQQDPDLDEDDGKTPTGAPRITQRFTVVGFTAPEGGRGDMYSLVLAQETPGSYAYVGTVQRGLTKELKVAALKRMKPAEKSPLGNTEVKARWVEPTLSCEVEYSSINELGQIMDPVFKKW